MEEEVVSPCIRNCCLDKQDVCVGCFRTLQQIIDWTRLTQIEKRQVLQECAKRRDEKLTSNRQ